MNEICLLPIKDGEDKSSILANCIRNNYRHLRKWAKKTDTDCFRIYDKDIPSFPLAIDFYGGRFCVQYFGKGLDSDEIPESLADEVKFSLKIVFGISPNAIYFRTRAKTKSTRQYEKTGVKGAFFICYEFGKKFKVNLTDYLDTGLFLDHRETRQLVAKLSQKKKVLNLFAYTCSFSLHAAANGAAFTKSVDMSNTYIDWGKDNFEINGLNSIHHEFIRADCLKFLDQEINSGMKYDLIILDPPTISRSKKMDQLFDIQVDYPFLINKCIELLHSEGILFFSTNSRKFRFDEQLFSEVSVQEISEKTLPIDFRDSKIHRCWKIQKFKSVL